MSKFLSLLLIFFFYSFSGFAQNQPLSIKGEAEVATTNQVKSRPKEGFQIFFKNFIEKFNSNKGSRIPKNISEVKIRLKFFVEKDGSFSNFEVLDDEYNLGKEAIRVMKEMPDWEPAYYDNIAVRSSFTMPIKIKVDQENLKSENILYRNDKAVKKYLETLSNNNIKTSFFDLLCDCAIVKSSSIDEYDIDEFLLQSQDDRVMYNVFFKEGIEEDLLAEVNLIKQDAMDRNVKVADLNFEEYNAIEMSFYQKKDNEEVQYISMFFVAKNYLVAITLKSNNQQLTKLTFNHLLQNFKLKI